MNMLYAVKGVCEEHAAAFGGLTPFVNAFDELKANIGALELAIRKQERSLVGVALDKRFKRDAMTDRTLQVANGLFAYAVEKGDLDLRERADLNRTDLQRGRDTVVAQRCANVLADGTAHAADLVAYGIEAADLAALATAIDRYVATIGSPRTALTVRKGATAEIALLLKDSLKVLTQRMDKLMGEFREAAPDFHQRYFDARIIVDAGVRSSGEGEAAAKAA